MTDDQWLPTAKQIDTSRTVREVRHLKLVRDDSGLECPVMERAAQGGRGFRFKPQILMVIYDWLDGAWRASNVIVRGRRLKPNSMECHGRRYSQVTIPFGRLRAAPLWVQELVRRHQPTYRIVFDAA